MMIAYVALLGWRSALHTRIVAANEVGEAGDDVKRGLKHAEQRQAANNLTECSPAQCIFPSPKRARSHNKSLLCSNSLYRLVVVATAAAVHFYSTQVFPICALYPPVCLNNFSPRCLEARAGAQAQT